MFSRRPRLSSPPEEENITQVGKGVRTGEEVFVAGINVLPRSLFSGGRSTSLLSFFVGWLPDWIFLRGDEISI